MRIEPFGLLLVDKPEGPTSHDTTQLVRRLTGIRRIGHTGTLDPFASGLLVLCVGWAARLAEYLTDLHKVYRGVVRLGEVTDTDDLTGAVMARNDSWRDLEPTQIRDAVAGHVGVIEQKPPIYSAKKVAGQRSYALARRGQKPELAARQVTIRRLTVVDLALPEIEIEIECSSGTYVRSVARDLGEALGVGGHLIRLRRIRVGGFSVADAIRPAAGMPRRELLALLRPPAAAVTHLPQVQLGPDAGAALRRGQPVSWSGSDHRGPIAVHVGGEFLGVGELRGGRLWPKKVCPPQPVESRDDDDTVS